MSEDDIRRGVYEEDYYDITGENWDNENDFDLYDFVDERQDQGLYYD